MKKVLKGEEPPLLQTYRNNHPNNTWEQFCNSSSRRKQTQSYIKTQQAGLCAYCEIHLIEATQNEKADFRVEHFHPKSDDSTAYNWHLDWQNLLGCCHGGSERYVAQASSRFTSPDNSCDVPKGSRDLDNVILNPLHIPATPALFSIARSEGQISVDIAACTTAGQSQSKAQATIDELQLDGQRLRRFRKALLDQLNAHIGDMVRNGQTVEQARTKLAQRLLRKDAQNRWPAFFTSIRSYLGCEAEAHLASIQYQG